MSERDLLARDIYLRFINIPGTSQKTPEHTAASAFDMADAFFAELETRREFTED